MITIYRANGTAIMAVQERDDSRYTQSLMGEHSVRLRFDWTEAIPLPYGSYIDYSDRRWTLYADYIPAQRDGVAEYDVAFSAPEMELANFTAFYMSQGAMEAEWDLTGTIAQFAREIEANLRRVGSSLTIQPSAYDRLSTAKHIDVDKLSIYELLGRMAEVFEIEWWLDGSEIRLGRIPEGAELVARIGELASAYTPSGEANTLIRRLYAFGATRNLTDSYRRQSGATSRIGEPRLRMPEGTEFVQGVANGIEDVQYFEDVYPRYVGRIASVSSRKSGDSTIYKISDSALTIKQSYILEGQTLRAQFTSGALNGMEFDLAIVSGGYEIVPSDSYGQTLPAGNLVPAVGDEYVPFGFDISMVGDEYVPRAEQELLQRATEWLRANNEDRRDVEVACNPVWVYERGVVLSLGQRVRLVDATPTGDKAGRITKIEYPLYCPQLATLIVGNAKPTTRLERLAYEARKEAEGAKSYAEDKQREAISHSERLFSQATETMRGLVAGMGERFGGVINPVAVKTMQLLAGDERLQFVFVEGESDRRAKPLNVEWQAGAKSVRIALPSWLMHYTLPESRTLAPRATETLPVWSLPESQSPALSEADKPYYLYAIASKSERTGYFAISTEPREDSSTDYALLVGMLSSEDAEGARSFAPLHGFSEVLPGRITTDRIVSADGETYFDLQRGEIGGNIKFSGGKNPEAFVNELIQNDKDVTEVVIDTTGLDENKYYPVVAKLPNPALGRGGRYHLFVERSLVPPFGIPTYSSHTAGFSLYLEWYVTPSRWGVMYDDRRVVSFQSRYLKPGEAVVSQPIQELRTSEELVYLRGGSKYIFRVEGAKNVPITLYPEGYQWVSGNFNQFYQVLDSISNRLPKTDIADGKEYSAREAGRRAEEAKAYARSQDELLRAGLTAELASKMSAIDAKHADLQRQLDGQTVRWFGEVFPPAKLWEDADEKHNGDTYTVVTPKGVTITEANAGNYPNVGKSWRWDKGGWLPIADSDATRALAIASNAQAAADGKVTHFVGANLPIGYRKGDIWTLPTGWNGFKAGSILVASANEVPGQVNLNHWKESNRYTDDSRLEDLRVGSRNLVLRSDLIFDRSKYAIANYTMAEPWQAGETYSVSVWAEVYGVPTGSLGENPPTIGIYGDGGSRSIGRARLSAPAQMIDGAFRGVWTLTGTFTEAMMQSPSIGNGRRLSLFLMGNQDGSIRSVVKKISIVKGHKPPTDWELAPEDAEFRTDRKILDAEKRANDYADSKVLRALDEDYLHKVIKDGTTTINGGLVLTNVIGALDAGQRVRSYISGDLERPAFASGLDDSGANPKAYIDHKGNAKFGNAYIDGATGQYSFASESGGANYMHIGGRLTPLAQLLSDTYSGASFNVVRSIYQGQGYGGESDAEDLSTIRVQHDGSTIDVALTATLTNTYMSDNPHMSDSELAPNPNYMVQIHMFGPSGFHVFWEDFTLNNGNMNTISVPISAKVHGAPAGEYTLSISGLLPDPKNNSASCRVSGSINVSITRDVKEIALAQDGMAVYYGKDRHLYAQRDGEPFLTIRGATFLNGYPLGTAGMLVCGEVAQSGGAYTIKWQAGIKRVVSVTERNAELTITHNIGHTDYMLTATNNRNRDIPRVIAKTAEYCRIAFVYPETDRPHKPQLFEFVINGKIV